MSHTVHLYGAKGGVGTTTVATLMALEHHAAGSTVVLAAQDGDHDDFYALLGRASTGTPVVLVADLTTNVTVVDHGTTPPEVIGDGDSVYLVTRSCYLALRRALGQNCRPDGIILIAEPGRSLHAGDVSDVLGAPVVATLAVTEDMARMIDAGLLAHRFSRFSRALRPLVQPPAAAA